MTDKIDVMGQAREWFNDLDANVRNQMVLTVYKLCIGISATKVSDHINSQWTEKFKKQEDVNRQLKEDAKIFSKLETLEKELNNLSNTRVDENIESILSSVPNSEIKHREGYFIFTINDVGIMVCEGENPENFKLLANEVKGSDNAHFAILAKNEISGKSVEMEIIYTKSGPMTLLYVTGLKNHPERILYAIDTGILLMKNNGGSQNDLIMYQLNNFIKGIQNVEDSIKERNKHVNDMISLIKKDEDHVEGLKLLLNNMLSSGNNPCKTNKDKILSLCSGLIIVHGENHITTKVLESLCADNNIPPRIIRDLGGIKAIKQTLIEGPKE